MTKPTLNVLVNKSAGHESYVALLRNDFEINAIDPDEYNNEHIDLIFFTGGEDVDPMYYNESKGRFTGINKNRDKKESGMMFFPRQFANTPKLGICRGAQFLTVMSGGKLIQHVNGHAMGGTHSIVFEKPYSGVELQITSTHHQMMFPYEMPKENYNIIATSKNFLSNTYLNGQNEEKNLPQEFEECEIVYYPITNALCIQGHPEFSSCPSDTSNFCVKLIRNFLKI